MFFIVGLSMVAIAELLRAEFSPRSLRRINLIGITFLVIYMVF